MALLEKEVGRLYREAELAAALTRVEQANLAVEEATRVLFQAAQKLQVARLEQVEAEREVIAATRNAPDVPIAVESEDESAENNGEEEREPTETTEGEEHRNRKARRVS
mmetsp:Transcript_77121/g.238855  ORF Transcript_77121/g.238855 Transcript_77121/m.238855 type:complete len:109 (-) Transcript_77121:110-436(-)